MKKEELVKLLEDNEYDYHTLPHYGLVPDFRVWYWQLHDTIWEYLDESVE